MRFAGLTLAVLALVLPACADGSATGSAHPGGDTCTDFEVEVERFWSASIRAQVMDKGGEIELDRRRGVVTKLDRISEDWVMMRTSTCKDHFVRDLISKDEYAARVRCFDDRLERQRTLATALGGAGSLVDIDAALDHLLAEPSSCAADPSAAEPPADAATDAATADATDTTTEPPTDAPAEPDTDQD